MTWGATAFKHIERNETDLVVADPFTGEIKKKVRVPYPNNSGALTTAGGLVFTGFTDGSLMAYDDATMEELWKINVGTGFQAPPMTFEVNGKQYIAIQPLLFWRGETGAAWEFHGSDGSAGAPWLSIHLCRCRLAFTVCLGVVTPVASWCSMVQRDAPWCNGATARRRLRVLRVTCNVGDVRCRP
jgi:hypothetical protein